MQYITSMANIFRRKNTFYILALVLFFFFQKNNTQDIKALDVNSLNSIDSPFGISSLDIKVDNSGNRHIVMGEHYLYYAFSEEGLTWEIESVDSTTSASYKISLALDSNGLPHVAYQQNEITEDTSVFKLKYATKKDNQWSIETIDSEAHEAIFLAIDSFNNPHIVYDSLDGLKYSTQINSEWSIQIVDTCLQPLPFAIQFDSDERIYILYRCGNIEGLRLAIWDGMQLNTQVINTGSTVHSASMMLDFQNSPYIAYTTSLQELNYLFWNGMDWESSIVANADLAYDVILELDNLGGPRIVYSDENESNNRNLIYAKLNEDTWTFQTLAPNLGVHFAFVLDTFYKPHIAYQTITGDIKYISIANNNEPEEWLQATDIIFPDPGVTNEASVNDPCGTSFKIVLNLNPSDGGTVIVHPSPTCPEDRYLPGTSITLTAFPSAEGYTFLSWGNEIFSRNNPYSFVLEQDLFIDANFVIPTGSIPSTPNLLSPKNNSLVKTYSPLLDWSNSTLATGTNFGWYRVEIDDNLDFSSPVVTADTALGDITASRFSPTENLVTNTKYYWRVRAFNINNKFSAWSPVWIFRTPLAPPNLVSPTTGENSFNLRPTFDWDDVNEIGVTGYTIQVSTSSAFTSIAHTGNTVQSAYTPTVDMPKGLLYWRVQTKGPNGPSAWSEIRSLQGPFPPPAPVLSTPASNSLSTSYTPLLKWKVVTLPTGSPQFDYYQVQIDDNKDFSSPDLDTSSLTAYYQVTSPLADNKIYYWRVRVANKLPEYGAWSSVYILRTALLQPILLSPERDFASKELRPQFQWEPVLGATGYKLQISKNNVFTQIVHTGNSIGTSYVPTSDLPKNTTLYWRVQSKGANGPSLFSDYRSIYTPSTPPSAPSLSMPAKNALVTNYKPTFKWNPVIMPAGTFQNFILQVDDNLDFSSPIVYETSLVSSSYVPNSDLTANTKYYWRVRVVNTSGEMSNWSSVWYVRTAIFPPSNMSPKFGENILSLRPVFNWDDVPGAGKYTIQISKSSNFSTILVTGTPSISEFRPIADLPAYQELYWRIQAQGLNGPSAWSAVEKIKMPAPPSIPVLISPLNININSYEPLLVWSPSTNTPTYYHVQVATSSTFANIILDGKTSETQYKLPVDSLQDLTQYYWRVRSFNEAGEYSNWSSPAWMRSPGKISGKVTDKTNTGIGGVVIQIAGKKLSGTTDSTGNYTIKGVPPGSHILNPIAAGYNFNTKSMSVSLSSLNLTGRNFIATELQTVSGTVVLDPRAAMMMTQAYLQPQVITLPDFSKIGLVNFGNRHELSFLTDQFIKYVVGSSTESPQTFGDLLKSVYSSVVTGVTVKDNQGHTTLTDQSGSYVIDNAVAGSYSLNLTKTGYSSIPINRSFYLSDDALMQYFMVTPILKPSTKLVYQAGGMGEASFSDNGRFILMTDNTNSQGGGIMDLYTGQFQPGNFNKGDISGSGRFVSYAIAGLPVVNWGVFGMDRDTDNNGVFDEPDTVETWPVAEGADWSKISTDGRYIVVGGGSCGGITIFDIENRTSICTDVLSTSGGFWPEISPNGRFIIFLSWLNLVQEDQNTQAVDAYIYDRDSDSDNIFDEVDATKLELISVLPNGQQIPDYTGIRAGAAPMASGNGRWVIFHAVDVADGTEIGNNVNRSYYLRDRQSNITRRLVPNVQPVNGCIKVTFEASYAEITPDGRFVLLNGELNCGGPLGEASYLFDRDTDQDGVFDEAGYTKFDQINLLFPNNKYLACRNLSADGRFCIYTGGGYIPSLPLPGRYIHDRGTNLSFSITGRITDGFNNPVPGVFVDAGDGRTAFTDEAGFYSLLGLPGGTYYLKASAEGLAFSPATRAVVVPPNSTGQDFKTTTGYVQLSSLSGRVTDLYGMPLKDILIDDGNGHQVITDNQGFYYFSDLEQGQYILTPVNDKYEFHPQPVTISVNGEEIAGLNFTGIEVYSISGQVVDQNGNFIEGATISNNYGYEVMTDINGYFIFTSVPAGGFTLTVSKEGYVFSPNWHYVEVTTTDVSSIQFFGQGP